MIDLVTQERKTTVPSCRRTPEQQTEANDEPLGLRTVANVQVEPPAVALMALATVGESSGTAEERRQRRYLRAGC